MNRLLLSAALVSAPALAAACGCFSPPVPESVDDTDFAVNQQAEQIIFEVAGDGFVTAHVLIKYQGDPEAFGWLVPVPNAPELSLSENLLFSLLDERTQPTTLNFPEYRCPSQAYQCRYLPPPEDCEGGGAGGAGGEGGAGGGGGQGGQGGDGGGDGGEPDVQVFGRQQVGAYDTVTLGGEDADDIVQWLDTEGFIVNDTMSPYMQPYLDEGMLFVASRLIPDADVSEIRPLKMRYRAEFPMVPLRLTAVAAEPHLTVTSYILADSPYAPRDQPLVNIPEHWLSGKSNANFEPTRPNYPMALARAADSAAGRGFVLEYSARLPALTFNEDSGCCGSDEDQCGLGDDEVCQCPGNTFDEADCGEIDGLLPAVAAYRAFDEDLVVSRVTTRLSAHEMTFDPIFVPTAAGRPALGSIIYRYDEIERCRDDVVEPAALAIADQIEGCAAVYCGPGECVATANGPGCECDAGFVGRAFTDLDGLPSVTCVPAQNTVDLSAGGIEIPDVCAGVDCGSGRCVAIGGFTACGCDAGSAVIASGQLALCAQTLARSGGPGAERQTAFRELDICSPTPWFCGPTGYLTPADDRDPNYIAGVECARTTPDPAQLIEPTGLTCEDFNLRTPDGAGGVGGGGGQGGSGGADAGPDAGDQRIDSDKDDGCQAVGGHAQFWLLGVGLLGLRRRRRRTLDSPQEM